MAGKKGLSGKNQGGSGGAAQNGSVLAKGTSASQTILATRTLLADHHAEDVIAATALLRDVILGFPESEAAAITSGKKLLEENPALWLRFYDKFMDRIVGKPLQRVEQETKDANLSSILDHLNQSGRDGVFQIAAAFVTTPDAPALEGPGVRSVDPDDAGQESSLSPRTSDES